MSSIRALINPEGGLCYAVPISRGNRLDIVRVSGRKRDEITRILDNETELTRFQDSPEVHLDNERHRIELLDNGNMYVSDSISGQNGYMMAGDWLVRFPCGELRPVTTDMIDKQFYDAGPFYQFN